MCDLSIRPSFDLTAGASTISRKLKYVEHKLKIITIADLIAYRQIREQLVERQYEFSVNTAVGEAKGVAYRTKFEDAEHLALVFGDIAKMDAVPVRIHREKLVDDVFGSQTDHEHNLMHAALHKVDSLGGGIVIYLRTGFVGVPNESLDERTKEEERRSQWLEVGVGAQIMRDLGVTNFKLIAGREVAYKGVGGFGLNLVSTEIL